MHPRISVLPFQYLPRIWSLGSPVPMSMGRLRLRVGNNSWNCIDLNKKRLQTDYQSNGFNRAVENEFSSMQLLSDMLAFESIDLPVTDEPKKHCSWVGIPLENSIYL